MRSENGSLLRATIRLALLLAIVSVLMSLLTGELLYVLPGRGRIGLWVQIAAAVVGGLSVFAGYAKDLRPKLWRSVCGNPRTPYNAADVLFYGLIPMVVIFLNLPPLRG